MAVYIVYTLYSFYIEMKYKIISERSYQYVFQSVETFGSVVTYESATANAVWCLAMDGSPGSRESIIQGHYFTLPRTRDTNGNAIIHEDR